MALGFRFRVWGLGFIGLGFRSPENYQSSSLRVPDSNHTFTMLPNPILTIKAPMPNSYIIATLSGRPNRTPSKKP